MNGTSEYQDKAAQEMLTWLREWEAERSYISEMDYEWERHLRHISRKRVAKATKNRRS